MKSVLKHMLPLIIGLFLLILIVIILFFVLFYSESEYKREQENKMKEYYSLKIKATILIYNEDNDKIGEYILNKENDYYLTATLPYNGEKKRIWGIMNVKHGSSAIGTGDAPKIDYHKEGKWERSDEVREKGIYDLIFNFGHYNFAGKKMFLCMHMGLIIE